MQKLPGQQSALVQPTWANWIEKDEVSMIFYLVGGGGRGFCLALKRINRQATGKAMTSGEMDGAFHNIVYNENIQ